MPHRRAFLILVASVLALWGVLPLVSQGAPGSLDSKIDRAREQLERKRGTERALSGDIRSYTERIEALQSRITRLQARQARLQASLDDRRAELSRVQSRLRKERVRLGRLRERLGEGRRALSVRLVEMYKADEPDLVSVVLSSDGFADLLERGEFLQRVSDQDRRIIDRVQQAKLDATRTTRRLVRLEDRRQRVAATMLARRNEVATVRSELVDTRVGYQRTRQDKARALSRTRISRAEIEGHLDELQAEQAQVLATLRSAQPRGGGGGGAPVAGPIRRGSGSLIWPVGGSVTSGYGQRWGRLHAGIDIPAPTGTPIRAADSGRVVLLGWTGGYGNYTCIQHSGSMSTCYAHQSRYGTSNGASVKQGQVIGYVGNTGHSYGAHLHFEVRIGGSPVDPMGYL